MDELELMMLPPQVSVGARPHEVELYARPLTDGSVRVELRHPNAQPKGKTPWRVMAEAVLPPESSVLDWVATVASGVGARLDAEERYAQRQQGYI